MTAADRGQYGVRAEDRAQRRFACDRRRVLGRGREERADVVGVARYDVVVAVGVHAPDVAELALGLEDELDLALVETQDLQVPGERDGRGLGERRGLLSRDGSGRRRRGCASG